MLNLWYWNTIKYHDENYYTYALLAQVHEPNFVSKALSSLDSAQWKIAMDKEYQSLIDNKTWQLVNPPPHRSIISTKWIF